jgi:hypothetical protein
LQHFVGIFKKILELVTLGSEHFGGELRGHFDSGNGGVFRDIANFVDFDAGLTGERGFDLLGKSGGLGCATGKRSHKTCELRLGKGWGEMDAGDSGGSQQLREAAFSRCRTKGHAVQ